MFNAKFVLPVILSSAMCSSGCATEDMIPELAANQVASNSGHSLSYALAPNELNLPCNKLKGRIQLRILEIRGRSPDSQPSLIATSLHQTVSTTGLWHEPTNEAAQAADTDIAVLKAYNRRLGKLGCAKYNIARELDPRRSRSWQIR